MKIIQTCALALLVAASGITFSTAGRTQDLQLEVGKNGPKLRLREDCDPARERCSDDGTRARRSDGRRNNNDAYDDDNDDDDDDVVVQRDTRKVCSENRALDKVERMGVRRAQVVAAGRRVIEIRGRDRSGRRVSVTVGRDRSCPILN